MKYKKVKSEELQMIFGSSNRIQKHRVTGAPYKVGKVSSKKLVTLDDLKGSSIYTQQVCNYLNEVEKLDVKHIKKEMSRNLQRKNKKEIPALPRLKAIEIWNYQIDKFLGGELKVMEEKSIKKPVDNYIELPVIFQVVCEHNGWMDKFETFRKKIPNTPEIEEILNKFFSEIAQGEGYKSSWKYRWANDLEGLKTIPEARKFLKKGMNDTFYRELFNLNCDGLGKSEILCAFLIKGASIMGGKEPYDLVIENEKIGREVHELKAMSNNGSIRLGKSKLIRYPFYGHVNDILYSMKRLDNQISDDKKLGFLSPELVYSWKNSIEEFQPSWIDGEVGEEKLRNFIMFLYYMHEYIRNRKASNYTTAIITNTFGDDSNTFSAPVDGKTYYKNDEDALLEFGSLRYVKDPDLLMKDLNDTIKDYFGRHIDYFTIFRPGGEINICNEMDLVFDQITQSATKPIEKKLSSKIRNRYPENKAWVKWKRNPSKSFDLYYQHELKR